MEMGINLKWMKNHLKFIGHKMIEKILNYGTIIGMAVGVLLWAQANFVDAMDFLQQQYFTVEEEINYLKDKELRLEQTEQKELVFEDRRKLERLENKLEFIQQQMQK